MTVTVIWLIAFAVFLYLALQSWSKGSLSRVIERSAPASFKGNKDDRWIWCVGLAVLGATFIVEPVSMLLTVLLMALITWIVVKLARWGMGKAKSH